MGSPIPVHERRGSHQPALPAGSRPERGAGERGTGTGERSECVGPHRFAKHPRRVCTRRVKWAQSARRGASPKGAVLGGLPCQTQNKPQYQEAEEHALP